MRSMLLPPTSPAIRRTARATFCAAAIVFCSFLAVQACRRYRGAAGYMRFELAWISSKGSTSDLTTRRREVERNIQTLRQSLRLDKTHAYAHYALARQYLDLHDLVSGQGTEDGCAPGRSDPRLCSHLSLAFAHYREAIRQECTKATYHEALGRWHLNAIKALRGRGETVDGRAEASMTRSGILGISLACDLDRGSSQQRLVLAQVYGTEGMIPAALGAYRQAWRQNLAFPREWRERRDRSNAILDGALAVRRNVWDVEWVVGESFADRIRIAKFLAARGKARFAEPLMMKAAESTAEGDIEQRAQIVDVLIRIRAGDKALRLIETWLTNGQGGGAPEWSVIELVSRVDLDMNLAFFLAIARAYDVLDDRRKAADVCERVCRRIDLTKHPLAVLDLAKRYVAQGRFDEGTAWLERWQDELGERPGLRAERSPEARKLLGQLAALYVRGERHGDAAKVFETLMAEARNASEEARRASQLAECYFALGRPREGLAVCGGLVQRHPDCAHAHFVLALSRRRAGDTTGAIAACEAAVRLAPRNTQYAKLLAKTRRKRVQDRR